MPCRRIHAVRAAAGRGRDVKAWYSVVAAARYRLRRARRRRGQSRTTCLAVSHGAPQLHAGVGKPGTRRLQRNAASPILPVRTCVRILLCAFDRPACSRRADRYGILLGFQLSPPPGSGSSVCVVGGGPPCSWCQRSQHHCSASWYACQTDRGRGVFGVVTAGGGGSPSDHGGMPSLAVESSMVLRGHRIVLAHCWRCWPGVMPGRHRRPRLGAS